MTKDLKLTDDQLRIAATKYAAPWFGQLNHEDVKTHAMGLLIRINAITGWRNPDDLKQLSALVHEFALYLQENCATLNSEEVCLAMRQYGITVKDWGKTMNLQLIDGPLSLYMAERKRVSQLEEQQAAKAPPTATLTAEQLTNRIREDIEADYQRFCCNRLNIQFVNPAALAVMVQDFSLTVNPDEYLPFAKQYLETEQKQQLLQAQLQHKQGAIATAQDVLNQISAGTHAAIPTMCKRFAVKGLFEHFSSAGYKHLYEQIPIENEVSERPYKPQ